MRVLSLTAIATVCLLAGCAAEVISSSPRSVVVRAGTVRVQEAQDLADKECAKHGRAARLVSRPGPMAPGFMFDCVA